MAKPPDQLHPAERLIFFTDAVVAIAMTLLILPLLESVSEAGKDGLDTAEYLAEHSGQLMAFALSFVIIATFWRSHDRIFRNVARQDAGLLRLSVAWMFTIVWLPVATSLVGSLDTDPLQVTVYIGTMLATSLLNVAIIARLRHHPDLLEEPDATPLPLRTPVTVCALFALALLVALVVPGLDYWALLLLLLNWPVETVLARRDRKQALPDVTRGG